MKCCQLKGCPLLVKQGHHSTGGNRLVCGCCIISSKSMMQNIVRGGLILTDYMKLVMNNFIKKYWKIFKFLSKMNGLSKNHYIDLGYNYLI